MLQFEKNPFTGKIRVFITTPAKTILITDQRVADFLIKEFYV
jgi:hypothetical protein